MKPTLEQMKVKQYIKTSGTQWKLTILLICPFQLLLFLTLTFFNNHQYGNSQWKFKATEKSTIFPPSQRRRGRGMLGGRIMGGVTGKRAVSRM